MVLADSPGPDQSNRVTLITSARLCQILSALPQPRRFGNQAFNLVLIFIRVKNVSEVTFARLNQVDKSSSNTTCDRASHCSTWYSAKIDYF